MSRLLSAVLLSGALCMPFTVYAQDHDRDQQHNQRYYDKEHKDYHQWNADTDRQYHEYLRDHHEKDHDWSKASARERQQFWNYQHEHSDNH